MKDILSDLRVGLGAFARLGSSVWGLAGRSGNLNLIVRPALTAAATGLTLLIPLLALSGEHALTVFPDPETDLQAAGRQPNITIYSSDGTKLGSRGSDLGEPVELTELPTFVIDSFLATEDRRFYDHVGFDPAAMMRAILINWRSGNVVQGGSTITQQLVKNLFLSNEQTLSRKIEELHLALWLEARLTKDEILALYLNRIYLGANTYGLSAASEAYFSKDPKDLTLAEAALLAGLPKAPSSLAPHNNYDGALARSHEVIGNLLEDRRIDELSARMARMMPPELALRDARDGDGYFLDHVAVELRKIMPDVERDVIVTTTLDTRLQRAAEAAVGAELEDEDKEALLKGAEQAALVAYDRSGGIVALIGGKSYRDSQFNRATQAMRQPGSAFKPFIFLAAMEAGFDQDTVLVDQAIQVDGWEPTNYKEQFLGPIRLREALARSSNTATVQITEAVGRSVVIDTARRLGISEELEPHPSLALGAFEVPLDELTAAYLPLAHSGFKPEPFAIKEVRTRSGEIVYTHRSPPPPRVISARAAEQMTDLLRSVMTSGTGRAALLDEHEVAGKTGTTNDWRDAWFVGYSAHFTAGVWVGNDDAREMDRVSGATYPARIWRRFMTAAHEATEAPPLPLSDGFGAKDPQLWALGATYDGLRNDLFAKVYGAARPTPYRSDDGIGRILSRQNRRRDRTFRSPQVQGRVVTEEPAFPSRSGSASSSTGVTGRVITDEPGDDG